MMQSPVNHNLKITPTRSNLSATGFRPTTEKHLNIANYKGSTWKETVEPFYTKTRRSRTRINHIVLADTERSSTVDITN